MPVVRRQPLEVVHGPRQGRAGKVSEDPSHVECTAGIDGQLSRIAKRQGVTMTTLLNLIVATALEDLQQALQATQRPA